MEEKPLQRNGGKDMISALPEELILQILSSLPTKTVITTSVLSKRWRSLWNLVPYLEFDSEEYKSQHGTFVVSVCKSMLFNKAPALESFKLVFDLDIVPPFYIEILIGAALSRNLRHLVLDFLGQEDKCSFPSSLCTCDTLETLILRLLFLDVSSPVLMKSLKTLHFIDVHYKDEASICNVLSGCPVLEEFVVERSEGSILRTFTIEVPSLHRLTISDDNGDGDGFLGYVVKTPSLKQLQIEMLRCQGFQLIAPELVKVDIADLSNVDEKFLESFTSVKRLSFDVKPWEITYPPSGTMFNQLVYLEIYTRENNWWDLLTLMLENSPKLQVLRLVDRYGRIPKDDVVGEKWNEPKAVPECLLSSLESFVWTRYHWEREEEKQVATYILEKAGQLKKARFVINHVKSKEVEERSQRLNELYGVVRASNSCQLVFEFYSSS